MIKFKLSGKLRLLINLCIKPNCILYKKLNKEKQNQTIKREKDKYLANKY